MPRTPLRRVSQGSLFAVSASDPDAQSDTDFLDAAVSELADEAERLQANVEGIKQLSESLATFNESFASWLYVMQMNALTIDWPQAPTDAHIRYHYECIRGVFILAAERDAIAAMEALQQEQAKAAAAAREAELTKTMEQTEMEITYTAGHTTTNASIPSAKPVKKKPGKPKLTAKDKKERSIEIEKIILCLPLEFRGSDPTLRRHMEMVIEGFFNAPNRTVKLTDLITPPDLSQARVNKCLIALVNRKVVQKNSSTGTVLYHWQGI
ncbi:DASH complex subunit Dam1-domain-containing protein [Mycena pura]|uniref:DASH complex subunit DAM1 n=1 Tax=Mycena pura TaxID=153505 RepID=A0AAD6VGJ3_9AGAR|nr:DASH complex subunit Dam1-domain-containing protein [Mycena pura]